MEESRPGSESRAAPLSERSEARVHRKAANGGGSAQARVRRSGQLDRRR